MSSEVAFTFRIEYKNFKGEKLEEFRQVIWIIEPPAVVLFVFIDEAESNLEESKFFKLPSKIYFDAFFEKNAYRVKQF